MLSNHHQLIVKLRCVSFLLTNDFKHALRFMYIPYQHKIVMSDDILYPNLV